MERTEKISFETVTSVLLHIAFCVTVFGLSASLGCGARGPSGCDDGTVTDEGSGDGGITEGCPRTEPRVHRAAATPCTTERGAGDFMPGVAEDCGSDAECVDGANGRCMASRGGAADNQCTFDRCYADAECTNAVCNCRPDATSNAPNNCLGGNCLVDSDCGTGGYCSPSVAFDRVNYPYAGYWCRTSEDTCLNDEDCPSNTFNTARCAYDANAGRWACSNALFLPPS